LPIHICEFGLQVKRYNKRVNVPVGFPMPHNPKPTVREINLLDDERNPGGFLERKFLDVPLLNPSLRAFLRS